MKKTLTKATAMVLAFILLFGSAAAGIGGFAQVLDTISVRANAEELKYGDLTYSVKNGEVTITGCDKNATTVDIPSKIDGHPVIIIGESAFFASGLTSITIPDSVTSIGKWAFESCNSLESISVDEANPVFHSAGNCIIETESKKLIAGCKNSIIPDDGSVTSIAESAFVACFELKSINIPESVTSIGDWAFDYCTGLESISVDANNPVYLGTGNCLIEKESKTLIVGCKNSVIPDDGSVTSIKENAFYECTELTGVTIPDSVTSIGDCAFQGCTGLSGDAIPDSVKSIGDYAFQGCTGLTGKAVPDNATSIGKRAFIGCKGLTNLTIPKSVTSIGEDAFNGCTGLESISVDASNPVYLGKSNCLIEKDSKTLIAGCKNSIIPDDGSVTNIAEGVLSHCTLPTSIIIPDSVKYIGDYAFYDCDGIKSITISDGVTNIGENTFGWCTDLTSVTIGNGIKKISDDAFYNCENLKDVYYNGTEKDREKNLSVKSGNDYLLNATWHYAEIRLENAKINVKSDEVYKNSKVTVTATAENVPEGYYLAVYDSGNEPVAKGDNKAVNYEIPGKVASDKTLTVKVVDADNNTQKDGNGKDLTAEINIKVKTGFFDILIAFFRMIFGMNKVTIKP